MLRVVGEQRPPEREQLLDAVVRDPVVDDPMLAAGVHESAPAQAGEVVRRLGCETPSR